MQFQPRSEKEINEANLIPDKTTCDFEVLDAKNEKSKKGNDMIHLKLKVFYGDGWRMVDDYLLEAMAAKLRHFCEGTALLAVYNAGNLTAEDCVGQCGKVKIRLKAATDDFSAKNEVIDYVVKEKDQVLKKASNPEAATSTPTPEDDDVPF